MSRFSRMAGDLSGRLEQIREWINGGVRAGVIPPNEANHALDIIDGKVIGLQPKTMTPGDRLAAEVDGWLNGNALHYTTAKLRAALDEYRSTSKGIGITVAETIGYPPDPIKVARLLLDALSGGALASLIGYVRDDLLDFYWKNAGSAGVRRWELTLDNLKSNLRALGEKIDE